jgi:putative FmdB family regulatory protein|tara:strand:- start:22073 stop:22420 length:348 start_codon:yes stop_codon:yes gene_type:complete
MPTYDYECSECGYYEEVFQKFSEKPLVRCPECKKHKFRRVILNAPHIAVKGDPTTVQHLADRNTQKLGKYELQDKMKADNMDKHIKDKEVNKFRSKINKMTAQEKKRYIEKGDNA